MLHIDIASIRLACSGVVLTADLTRHAGFTARELLKVGCSRPEIIAISSPESLHAAGVPVVDLLKPEAARGLVKAPPHPEQVLGGFRGAATLRAAGYGAGELLDAGVHTAWDLRSAGYTADEMARSRATAEELVTAGFAAPLEQPVSFLASTVGPLCAFSTRQMPPNVEGTRTAKWEALLKPAVPSSADTPSSSSKPSISALRPRVQAAAG